MKLPGFMQFTPHERKAILALLLFTGGGGLLIEAGRRFPAYFSGLLSAGGGAGEDDSVAVSPEPVASTALAHGGGPVDSSGVDTVGTGTGDAGSAGTDPATGPGWEPTRAGLMASGVSPRTPSRETPRGDDPITSPIDINRADEITLTRLPGIGPRLAQRILADRAEKGPFRSVDELVRVKGIGPATVARLRPMITVG